MYYAVFADLSRQQTKQERSSLFAALDTSVPDSGCVGPRKDSTEEVYFALEALSEAAASAQAEQYMSMMLQKAALDVEYALTLQRMPPA